VAQLGDLLHRLTIGLTARDGTQPLSGRLCDVYRDLAGAEGAALTVRYQSTNRVTLSTTNEVARRLEDLQDVMGEGPGHTASESGQIEVCAVPGTASSRWSMFVEAAQDIIDQTTVHAVPMRPEVEVFGVITLYHDHGSRRLALERAQLQFLANVVGAVLLGDKEAVAASGPWLSRATIHQATGMVVAQLRVSPEDALAVLRAHAYGQQATLSEIASAVVERRVSFSTP
jgi:hypothetical protein